MEKLELAKLVVSWVEGRSNDSYHVLVGLWLGGWYSIEVQAILEVTFGGCVRPATHCGGDLEVKHDGGSVFKVVSIFINCLNR